MKVLGWSQHYSLIFLNSEVSDGILQKFKPIQAFMVGLVACKNEEDPIKNEGARVVTTLFINFSDAQGQLTPKSVMESCGNSNPSKLLWLVLLSARMKKIHPKMKVLEWSQHTGIFLQFLEGALGPFRLGKLAR